MKLFKPVIDRSARPACLALILALCLLLSGCGAAGAPAPQPGAGALPPQPTPPALAALAARHSPCDQLANDPPAGAAGAQPRAALAAGLVHYDYASNTILVRRGADTTLAGIRQALGPTGALQELAAGQWLLTANLRVEAGARLRVAAPEVRWLKLRSDATSVKTRHSSSRSIIPLIGIVTHPRRHCCRSVQDPP